MFEKNPGLKIEIPHDASIWSYLNLFITDEINNLIVVETNRNTDHVFSKHRLTKSSRFCKWVPTNEVKIKHFIGLLMWMGLVQMSSLIDYCSVKMLPI